MPNLLRNVLAVLAGIAVGGGVNMALITLSPWLIPPPAGVDVSNPESLSKAMHLFEPRHFVMRFLAHAAGTLAGALAAYLIAAGHEARIEVVTTILDHEVGTGSLGPLTPFTARAHTQPPLPTRVVTARP